MENFENYGKICHSMNDEGWIRSYNQEIKMAEDSRTAGNEGRARVCARRAVGILLGEYFHLKDMPDPGPSAMDRINYFLTRTELPAHIREIASHFIVKIDYDHQLPIHADLIEEARRLAIDLLGYQPIPHPENSD